MKDNRNVFFYIPFALGIVLLLIGHSLLGAFADTTVKAVIWGTCFICLSIGFVGLGIAKLIDK